MVLREGVGAAGAFNDIGLLSYKLEHKDFPTERACAGFSSTGYVLPAVPEGARARRSVDPGLSGLRRGVSELLFLYECATQDVRRLRPVADRLGLTVQSASHLQSVLRRRGLLDHRSDRYRPTAEGMAWLERQLTQLNADVGQRLGRLKIVRATRAIAGQEVQSGAPVHLEMVRGALTALPGSGGSSRGIARARARAGDLVEVDALEGIVPIARGRVVVAVVPVREVGSPEVRRAAQRVLREVPHDWIGTQGIEAIWLSRQLGQVPAHLFAVGAACREAANLGASSLAFVTEDELARFLEPMTGPDAPSIELRHLFDRSKR